MPIFRLFLSSCMRAYIHRERTELHKTVADTSSGCVWTCVYTDCFFFLSCVTHSILLFTFRHIFVFFSHTYIYTLNFPFFSSLSQKNDSIFILILLLLLLLSRSFFFLLLNWCCRYVCACECRYWNDRKCLTKIYFVWRWLEA